MLEFLRYAVGEVTRKVLWMGQFWRVVGVFLGCLTGTTTCVAKANVYTKDCNEAPRSTCCQGKLCPSFFLFD